MLQVRRAVVLVSGGLDSATTLAIAKANEFELFTLSFDYGQRHRFELQAAERVCAALGVSQHIVFKLNIGQFGGSALTADIAVPKNRFEEELATGIPVTYVPARNTVFLSVALSWAEVLGAADIFIGVNAVDYSGYPDCRPEFIEAFTKLANLATKVGVEGTANWNVHTPLIQMTKADIIKEGTQLGVDYSLTHSCYDPLLDGSPCGHCDSCHIRRQGFLDAALEDPLHYPQN